MAGERVSPKMLLASSAFEYVTVGLAVGPVVANPSWYQSINRAESHRCRSLRGVKIDSTGGEGGARSPAKFFE